MSKTLYRKYRPQNFSEVVGQEHIKITLQSEIENNKIAHAYLFSGPRGIGKTTIARILAKSINCVNRQNFEPCNECASCKSISSASNLDLIEIDAASNRGINEIRELREMVKYAPAKDKYKVFIIDEVHMLTVEAFNALLKTLEEPPKHAIFILATTEFHKLPATIVSRCQKFDFRAVDIEKLKSHLKNVCSQEKIKVDNNVIEEIAKKSGGYVRDALSTLGQILSLSDNNEVNSDIASLILPKSNTEAIINILDSIIFQKFDFAIKALDSLVSDGVNLQYFTEELINYLRKVILVKMSGVSEKYLWDVDKNEELKIIEQAEKLSLNIWYGILKEFYLSFDELNNDRFKQLPLEMAIVSIKSKYFPEEVEKPELMKKIEQKNNENIQQNKKVENEDNDELVYEEPIVPEEKKETKEETIKPKSKDVKLKSSLDDISKAWPKLLLNLKDYNHSLSAFLKSGHPLDLKLNRLTVGFQFKFHLDRIMNEKNKIEEILSGIINENVYIEPVLDENYKDNRQKITKELYKDSEKENEAIMDNLVENFGGKVA